MPLTEETARELLEAIRQLTADLRKPQTVRYTLNGGPMFKEEPTRARHAGADVSFHDPHHPGQVRNA